MMRNVTALAVACIFVVGAAHIRPQIETTDVQAPTPIVVPSVTSTAMPPSVTPRASDTPTPTLTRTPTLTPAHNVHVELMSERCMQWVYVVWANGDEWSQLDPAIVLAIMAKESGCDPNGTDIYSESTGLMQVNPSSVAHLGVTKTALLDPLRNTYWGMRILTRTLTDAEHNPGEDLERALAAYNCGWASLDAGRCYSFGGYTYAADILEIWVPAIRETLGRYVCDPPAALGTWRLREDVLEYLAAWGYACN